MEKEYLNELLLSEAPGPAITFSVFDLIKALELIHEKGYVGRGKLSDEMKIGEGAIRTLIKRLKNSSLLKSSKYGCSLTKKGNDLWERITLKMPRKARLSDSELKISQFNIAVLLKHASKGLGDGMVQRDAAIRAGADGAVTIICENGKLVIPGIISDVSKSYPVLYSQLIQVLAPKDGDVIIVGNGGDLKSAEYGALAASLTLI